MIEGVAWIEVVIMVAVVNVTVLVLPFLQLLPLWPRLHLEIRLR